SSAFENHASVNRLFQVRTLASVPSHTTSWLHLFALLYPSLPLPKASEAFLRLIQIHPSQMMALNLTYTPCRSRNGSTTNRLSTGQPHPLTQRCLPLTHPPSSKSLILLLLRLGMHGRTSAERIAANIPPRAAAQTLQISDSTRPMILPAPLRDLRQA